MMDGMDNRIAYLRMQYAYHFQMHSQRMAVSDAREYLAYLISTPDAYMREKRIEHLISYLNQIGQ